MTGRKFGRLTVVCRSSTTVSKNVAWKCRCACGNDVVVLGGNLRNGSTQSCGCLAIEKNIGNSYGATHGEARHIGKGRTPEYRTWQGMIQRCKNPKNPGFRYYGGRGITVCDRWLDFSLFLSDMGRRESLGHTLDRIDNNGNYEPGNCRWVTHTEQVRNSRHAIPVEFAGESMPLSAWSEKTGISRSTLKGRIERGWQLVKVFTSPVRRHRAA